ncbi:MAG: TlpA family protein disulfide reductase [Deltaproteobacteria bacterium]|jgi:cytochrome c biogenesis protein CcmG, thiol:disulfide interchange protein DsbE|nr:TlpA family protein disulfide reductase [Deltaproteobacteria bacterium]MBT4091921.1 TlpA family protein disulfide reductase [Deltaproteobacteria bacterium]MBT4263589.1 TlpA family protein disulfide reductase [Deltaproteobacteria bacterium]MBT4644332.1 TlpA family protein disulfide reductase [Deltaproteobacteria bacterium]MBT6500413.1 TlpA family protein disulfide reductase [Deltaproteobacteria bacterium]
MKRKPYFLLGIFVTAGLVLILIYGLFYASRPGEIPSAQISQKAKPFQATTFDGQTISLQQFRGQPVILNFWASWCVACRREAHIIEAAYQKYGVKGAVFIGIAINDTREASLGFIRRYGKTYLLAPDNKTGTISLDYGVTAVPETFLIDKNGIISEKVLGAITKLKIDRFLLNQL